MREVNFHRMIAWGQYIHWANIQHDQYKLNASEDLDRSSFIGLSAHWLAAQYVVIEGWIELKEEDESINQLLTKYQDFVDILRKCRNAVYHYQNEIFDKRIQDPLILGKGEFIYWVIALKEEFERYLYLYPFKICGMSIESAELHDEYLGCIGWKPKDNLWVRWLDL